MLTKAGRYGVVVGITVLTFALEMYGSYTTRSHSLFADALHLLGDGIPFVLGWFIVYFTLRDEVTKKLERVIIFLNCAFLFGAGIYIALRGLWLLVVPSPVESTVLIYAVVGLVGNGAQLYFAKDLHDVHHHEHTHKSQMLHLFGDAVSSVGVIVGALVVYFTGYTQADTYASLLVAAITLWAGWKCLQGMLIPEHQHHHHH